MSIWSSLYTGRSGLTAHSDAINVVGDNIANVSTVGFKAGSAKFNDVLGRRIPGGQSLGAGVKMGGVSQAFGQGSFIQSGGSLDYAIQGGGFFEVAGEHNGVENNYYTRNGRFSLNADGLVVNEDGLRLQGYQLDANGEPFGAPGDLAIGGQSDPAATTSVDFDANLDPNATGAGPWDPLNPETSADYQTSTTVYDSLGNSREVQLFFVNNGAGAWEWHAMVDGSELNGGTPGTLTEIADGTLGFDTDGNLDTEVMNASSADFQGATPGQVIQFDFGDAITTDGGTGEGSSQVAGQSAVESISQDGREPGQLLDIVTADDGTISGIFSNGEQEDLAMVAVASFRSPENLRRQGDQLWVASRDSGQALLGEPGTSGRGAIASNALEGSNVDLGDELVTLIAYQRAFQSNARTITTADEMLTEVTNLKR
ncbi:MAG: flagellar hook protein FlgE [Nannocystaceae bacterium]|nr:flagellar hook protein FlgE [bacterium]